MGNTYKVKIISPNSKIIFRGKVLRTPVVCKNVYEKELPFMKLQMHKSALQYEIIDSDDEDIKETNINVVVSETVPSVKEPLNEMSGQINPQFEKTETHSKEIEIEEFYDPSVEENSLIDRLIEAEKAGK